MGQTRKRRTAGNHAEPAANGTFVRARVTRELYDAFERQARGEERTVSAQLRFLMRSYVDDDAKQTAA